MSGRWEGIRVMDYDRATETSEGEREVIAEREPLRLHVDEVDSFVQLPVRITTGPLIGPTLELGPYSLSENDAQELLNHLSTFLSTFCSATPEQQQ